MEKGFFIRTAALIFTLLMLLSAALAACGDAGTDDKPAENTASDTAGDETAEVTTTEAVDENIPAGLDFGGRQSTSGIRRFRQRLGNILRHGGRSGGRHRRRRDLKEILPLKNSSI